MALQKTKYHQKIILIKVDILGDYEANYPFLKILQKLRLNLSSINSKPHVEKNKLISPQNSDQHPVTYYDLIFPFNFRASDWYVTFVTIVSCLVYSTMYSQFRVSIPKGISKELRLLFNRFAKLFEVLRLDVRQFHEFSHVKVSQAKCLISQ